MATVNAPTFVRPRPGDLTVCLGCGTLLTFTPELQQRQMTDAELGGLDNDERGVLFETQRYVLERRGLRVPTEIQ